tara:strand:- start:508 stop:648 length:141 start_codon:yes stop_codon:yes gene_type:complete
MNILEKEVKYIFLLLVALMGYFRFLPSEIGAIYPKRGLLNIEIVKK